MQEYTWGEYTIRVRGNSLALFLKEEMIGICAGLTDLSVPALVQVASGLAIEHGNCQLPATEWVEVRRG